MEWISAAEGLKFAATMKEFIEEVKELGSGPFNFINYVCISITNLQG